MRDTPWYSKLFIWSLYGLRQRLLLILCFIAVLFLGVFRFVKILIPCNFKIFWLSKLNIYSKTLQLLQKTGSKAINLCDKSLSNYTCSREQFLVAAMGCFQKLMPVGRSRVSYHAWFLYRFVKWLSSPVNSLYIELEKGAWRHDNRYNKYMQSHRRRVSGKQVLKTCLFGRFR
jgi:hypothetical protein